MIYIKTREEIELMRESALIVSRTLGIVSKEVRPGVTPKLLDKIAEEFIRDNGGVPAFKGYRGFPATLCISINEAVVHGIPGARRFAPGDLVGIDCGLILNG